MTEKNNTQKPKFFNTLPIPGDIVLCYFPEDLKACKSGKHRPAIVMAVSSKTMEVEVAFGTSKKIDRIYPKEVLFDQASNGFERTGLHVSTKFDFGRMVKLPFNSEWFVIPIRPPGRTSPILGSVPPADVARIKAVFNAG